MSFGLMSAIRLTWFSWVGSGLEPPRAAVTGSLLGGIATSLMITPSTTYSGSAGELIEVTPRRRTWTPPPGAPELVWMSAPASLPWSCCSMLGVGTFSRSSALMVATAFGRFRRSMPVNCPVTTTSSSFTGSRASATSTTAAGPAGTATSARR